MADELTHLDEKGRLKMVDVGGKEKTERLARVRGEIRMRPETVCLITENRAAKGNVLYAEGEPVSVSSRIGTYAVRVTEEDGTLIATFQGRAYRKPV